VPAVPTGMKTGVSTIPCGVWRRPARAPVVASSATISNRNGMGYSRRCQDDAALRQKGPLSAVAGASHAVTPCQQEPPLEFRPSDFAYRLTPASQGPS